MSQADLEIPAHLLGAAFRAAVTDALIALTTQMYGPTAPTTTYPGMIWVDSSVVPEVWYRRNAADDAWVEVAEFLQDAASKAEQEAGTEASKYVAPATQQFHPSAVKAWVMIRYTGTAPGLIAAYNVASVARISTGKFRVTFTEPFSTANYGVLVTSCKATTTSSLTAIYIAPTTGYADITVGNTNSLALDPLAGYPLTVLFLGDQ